MSSKSPVFPMSEHQHFSDYGFDPQIDYFQVLEEARTHGKQATRSMETFRFKLQKPTSKDDHSKKRRRWWKEAYLFVKSKWSHHYRHRRNASEHRDQYHSTTAKSGQTFTGSISGPIYITDSFSGCSSPFGTTNRPTSGPLAGSMTPTRKGDAEMPYFSLRNPNMDQPHRIPASPLPIYVVT
ncbi:hypothetical protein Nepgr_020612 [Nepenthes gracilis]|uniref:Uncharacterized protein n=1 Tax=Nepenthes gracilis TaxID=150966 RepID=A0AAD3SZ36_NEPGR|nr:hypothetical protein Nepgr_020612 [Nepenthes gracilis]